MKLSTLYNELISSERQYHEWKEKNHERRKSIEELFGHKLTDNEYMNLCFALDNKGPSPVPIPPSIAEIPVYVSLPNFIVTNALSDLHEEPIPGTIVYCLKDNNIYVHHEDNFHSLNMGVTE